MMPIAELAIGLWLLLYFLFCAFSVYILVQKGDAAPTTKVGKLIHHHSVAVIVVLISSVTLGLSLMIAQVFGRILLGPH